MKVLLLALSGFELLEFSAFADVLRRIAESCRECAAGQR